MEYFLQIPIEALRRYHTRQIKDLNSDETLEQTDQAEKKRAIHRVSTTRHA